MSAVVLVEVPETEYQQLIESNAMLQGRVRDLEDDLRDAGKEIRELTREVWHAERTAEGIW